MKLVKSEKLNNNHLNLSLTKQQNRYQLHHKMMLHCRTYVESFFPISIIHCQATKSQAKREICAVPLFAGLGGQPEQQRNTWTSHDGATWRQNV